MTALGWILFAACNIASGALGWLIHLAIAEHAEFRTQEQRDPEWDEPEWDEQHGIRHG